MRKTTEVLRLRAAQMSARDIARAVGVARSTVAEYLRRADAAGVSWPGFNGAVFPRSAPPSFRDRASARAMSKNAA